MISCILLSAGFSSRFGSPKALTQLPHRNTTVIEYLQQELLKTKVKQTIIVLGAQAQNIKPKILKHKRIETVYNKDHNFGQTSSFKCGLNQLRKNTSGILLLPIDYPCINSKTINNLILQFTAINPTILIPTFNKKKGHPPLFHIKLKQKFLDLDNALGLNKVAQKYSEETVLFPIQDEGILKTFNTKEEFNILFKDNSSCCKI